MATSDSPPRAGARSGARAPPEPPVCRGPGRSTHLPAVPGGYRHLAPGTTRHHPQHPTAAPGDGRGGEGRTAGPHTPCTCLTVQLGCQTLMALAGGTTASTVGPGPAPPSLQDAGGRPPPSWRSGTWRRPQSRLGRRSGSPRRPNAAPSPGPRARAGRGCRPCRTASWRGPGRVAERPAGSRRSRQGQLNCGPCHSTGVQRPTRVARPSAAGHHSRPNRPGCGSRHSIGTRARAREPRVPRRASREEPLQTGRKAERGPITAPRLSPATPT